MTHLRLLLFIGCLIFVLAAMRRAAGRLAPKAGIGALLFLVSRWPVAVVWMLSSAAMFAWMGTLAVQQGKEGGLGMLAAISVLCGGGAAALAVGPIWAILRGLGDKPGFVLEAGETVAFETPGNHFLSGESRGGTLLLTDRRIGFRPHRFNVQLSPWSARLDELESIEREGLNFLVLRLRGRTDAEWLVAREADELARRLSL